MASRDAARFVARVYEDDYREIQKLVQLYPDIETGGDLFGLWQDAQTVVIQLFIGPGKKCRRTTASFHQDIEYLRRVGSLITSKEGLCNVGEWHSHHQISMPRPSAADERTVFSNMPQLGLERFVLFIATIESGKSKKRPLDVKLDHIVLNCFLFLQSTHKVVRGEIEIIRGNNPHSLHNRARKEIKDGAEEVPLAPKEDVVEKARKSSDEEQRSSKKKGSSANGRKAEKENKNTLKQQSEQRADPNIQGNVAGKPAQQAQGVAPTPRRPGPTTPLAGSREEGGFPAGKNGRDDERRKGQQSREGESYQTPARGGANVENVSPNTRSTRGSGGDHISVGGSRLNSHPVAQTGPTPTGSQGDQQSWYPPGAQQAQRHFKQGYGQETYQPRTYGQGTSNQPGTYGQGTSNQPGSYGQGTYGQGTYNQAGTTTHGQANASQVPVNRMCGEGYF